MRTKLDSPPTPPPGVHWRHHWPTIEAGIRHWAAVEAKAIARREYDLARTAAGLRMSYEDALRELGDRPDPPRKDRSASVPGMASPPTSSGGDPGPGSRR